LKVILQAARIGALRKRTIEILIKVAAAT